MAEGGGSVPPEKEQKLDDFAEEDAAFFYSSEEEKVEEDEDDCFDDYPDGVLKEQRPLFDLFYSKGDIQMRQSKGFDVLDYPGGLVPVRPLLDFSAEAGYFGAEAGLLTELAERAIKEYNEKECSVFKYRFLKIEKVNFMFSMYYQYFMTVKVLNLTLVTPIDTFQIHVGVHILYGDKVIRSCLSKEELVEMEWDSAAWKRELPSKYLADEEGLWDDDNFIPNGALKEHRDVFRKIYTRYFRQICQSNGFDIDIYPGDAKAAIYIPYLNFEEEADMLMELANHAIQDYDKRDSSVHKHEVVCIEKVNFIFSERPEFFMTVIVKNLSLPRSLETFQIHAYKGPNEENIVCICRKKMLI